MRLKKSSMSDYTKFFLLCSVSVMMFLFTVSAIANAEPLNDFYIIQDSAYRYLSDAEIADMSPQILNYAKNEIYARLGRKFLSGELQAYFGSQAWYNGSIEPADFPESSLNEYERYNAELLSAREKALAGEGGYLLDQSYSFQPVYDYLDAKTYQSGIYLYDEHNVDLVEYTGDDWERTPLVLGLAEPFRDFVAGYGIISSGEYRNDIALNGYPGWCEQEGVIGAYVADYNNDGRKECLMVYLTSEPNAGNDFIIHPLHIAILSENNDVVQVAYDEVMCYFDSSPFSDINLYLKRSGEDIYLVLSDLTSFNGTADSVRVFHVNESDDLVEDIQLSWGTEGGEPWFDRIQGDEYIDLLHFDYTDPETDLYAQKSLDTLNNEMRPYQIPFGGYTRSYGGMTWKPYTDIDPSLQMLLAAYRCAPYHESDPPIEYGFMNYFPDGELDGSAANEVENSEGNRAEITVEQLQNALDIAYQNVGEVWLTDDVISDNMYATVRSTGLDPNVTFTVFHLYINGYTLEIGEGNALEENMEYYILDLEEPEIRPMRDVF